MRLIDVSVLKEWVENWFTKNRFYHPYAKNNNIPITELYDILEQMPSAQPERKQMTNKEWIDFLSVQFDISRTSAREMLHGMMQCKKEDNYKRQFNRRVEQE